MQIRCLTKSQVSPVTLTGPGLYCFIRGKRVCLFGWRKNLPGECRQAEGLAKPLFSKQLSGFGVERLRIRNNLFLFREVFGEQGLSLLLFPEKLLPLCF